MQMACMNMHITDVGLRSCVFGALPTLSLLKTYLLECVCVCVCDIIYIHVRGQLEGVGSLLPSCGFQ